MNLKEVSKHVLKQSNQFTSRSHHMKATNHVNGSTKSTKSPLSTAEQEFLDGREEILGAVNELKEAANKYQETYLSMGDSLGKLFTEIARPHPRLLGGIAQVVKGFTVLTVETTKTFAMVASLIPEATARVREAQDARGIASVEFMDNCRQ